MPVVTVLANAPLWNTFDFTAIDDALTPSFTRSAFTASARFRATAFVADFDTFEIKLPPPTITYLPFRPVLLKILSIADFCAVPRIMDFEANERVTAALTAGFGLADIGTEGTWFGF